MFVLIRFESYQFIPVTNPYGFAASIFYAFDWFVQNPSHFDYANDYFVRHPKYDFVMSMTYFLWVG